MVVDHILILRPQAQLARELERLAQEARKAERS